VNHGLRLARVRATVFYLARWYWYLILGRSGWNGTLVLLAASGGPSNNLARARADLDELFTVQENPEGSSL